MASFARPSPAPIDLHPDPAAIETDSDPFARKGAAIHWDGDLSCRLQSSVSQGDVLPSRGIGNTDESGGITVEPPACKHVGSLEVACSLHHMQGQLASCGRADGVAYTQSFQNRVDPRTVLSPLPSLCQLHGFLHRGAVGAVVVPK